MSSPDFVAIGDTVVDAFIRLKDASVHCNINRQDCELCMRFGDKVPFEAAYVIPAVGNSANAAVSAARLGLTSGLVTSVGKDRNGEDCLAALRGNGVMTEYVAQHEGIPTNYHYVLWYEDERTILIKHEAFPYAMPVLGAPRWMYLSSLGEHAAAFHAEIATYLEANPDTKLAFQPGTFQMKLGVEALRGIYERTEVFFCNRDEAGRILGAGTEDIRALLDGIRALGPKVAIITDGPEGAYAGSADGAWFMPPYPDPAPPYERTGAGDAFSSTVIAALALGLPVDQALRWGPVNSMSVVQKVGAQEGLLDRASLEALLANAPADYLPRAL